MTQVEEEGAPYEATNEQVIEKYLDRYRHSVRSRNSRKYNLDYFFQDRYFGYQGHIFDIQKRDVLDFFDYLNHKEDLCLKTKINKWNTFRSFLQFSQEYYDSFRVVIPTFTVHWKPVHKLAKTNKDVVLEREEIQKILKYCVNNRYVYYIVYRMFAECGMRMGELRSIDIGDVNIEKRYVETRGKTGRNVYYFSRDLARHLALYLMERKIATARGECPALFVSCRDTRYSERAINGYLRTVTKRVSIAKRASSHTFRRSLNTLRKKMGCPSEDRRILLCHRVQDVNYACYVKLNYQDYINLYDKWYPYKNLEI